MKQAACVIIFDRFERKILATNRRGSFQIGLPGGKLDENERPIDAVIRELYEETGVPLTAYAFVNKQSYVDSVPGDVDYQTYCFLKEVDLEYMPIPGGSETGIYAFWVPVDDLLDPNLSPFAEYNKQAFSFFGII